MPMVIRGMAKVAEFHPIPSEDSRRSFEDSQWFPKVFPKTSEDFRRLLEDSRTYPKTTQRISKNSKYQLNSTSLEFLPIIYASVILLVFETKIPRAYLFPIALEIMWLLV